MRAFYQVEDFLWYLHTVEGPFEASLIRHCCQPWRLCLIAPQKPHVLKPSPLGVRIQHMDWEEGHVPNVALSPSETTVISENYKKQPPTVSGNCPKGTGQRERHQFKEMWISVRQWTSLSVWATTHSLHAHPLLLRVNELLFWDLCGQKDRAPSSPALIVRALFPPGTSRLPTVPILPHSSCFRSSIVGGWNPEVWGPPSSTPSSNGSSMNKVQEIAQIPMSPFLPHYLL